MSRSVKEIIEYCRETKEEMSLSDFKTCINAIYFHIGQAMKYEDGSRLSNNHLRIADNICAATSDCFLDENDNLVNWFKGEECSFTNPVTRQKTKIKVRDDYEAVYCFLRYCIPSPFMNVLMDYDIYNGGKYNNFGIHGTGIATAADSLAAIKKYVYEEKSISKEDYIKAVDRNFENDNILLHKLRFESPKLGNNDDYVDGIAVKLLDTFADSLEGRKNCRGGIFRAGTGSAMYYLWHANEIGASPDGRRKGEPLGTNFSVSLFAKVKGPVSVIGSMTKPHFERAINGGPLTLEFHQSLFTDEESIEKVGMIVKSFIDRGGHQLQLNAVNVEKLKDAQKHPENYKQLVVRIWGWSAYFVELDKEYQDQVIARQVYSV